MSTAIEVKNGLHDMQATINNALASIDDDMPLDDALDIAEAAIRDAHAAYRSAIGATCPDCGAENEWAIGLA